jgi:hypothetical protein
MQITFLISLISLANKTFQIKFHFKEVVALLFAWRRGFISKLIFLFSIFIDNKNLYIGIFFEKEHDFIKFSCHRNKRN